MTNASRIRTPWVHRWRRFRYSALPALSFIACVLATAWFWQKQGQMPNAVASVQRQNIQVTAPFDGTLVELPRELWKRFDTVKKDELVARLDDAILRETLKVLEEEYLEFRRQLEAEQVRIAMDEVDRRHDYQRQATRLAWEAEQQRLEVLDRQILIATDQIELQRLNARLAFLRPLHATQVISDFEMTDNQLQRDLISKQIEENQTALAQVQIQLAAAERRARDYPLLELAQAATPATLLNPMEALELVDAATAQTLLAPFRAAVIAQQARVDEVQQQIKALEIRSPIDGTISQIDYLPGQNIEAGEPIMTIAGPGDCRYAVSYLRQGQPLPEVGTPVDIRVRAPGSRPVAGAVVDHVGGQMQAVPLHQLRDPNFQEWGLPVRIALPSGFHVPPGQLIDITFKTWAGQKAG